MGDDAASQFRDYAGIEKGHVDVIPAKGAPKAKTESKPASTEKPKAAKKTAAKKTAAKK